MNLSVQILVGLASACIQYGMRGKRVSSLRPDQHTIKSKTVVVFHRSNVWIISVCPSLTWGQCSNILPSPFHRTNFWLTWQVHQFNIILARQGSYFCTTISLRHVIDFARMWWVCANFKCIQYKGIFHYISNNTDLVLYIKFYILSQIL